MAAAWPLCSKAPRYRRAPWSLATVVMANPSLDLKPLAPRAKLARNHGPNVMDGGRLYHVTFLRLASLKLRALTRARSARRRANRARLLGLTRARAGEVLADLLARPLRAGALSRGDADRQSRRHLAPGARGARPRRPDRRRGHAPLEEAAHAFRHRAARSTPYHEHNAERERPRLLARLRAGQSVALISDAGTPLSPTPATSWCARRSMRGIMVTSIPGPSAALAALTSAGLPTDTFLFAGFLPPKSGPRRARLEELKTVPATLHLLRDRPAPRQEPCRHGGRAWARARRRSPRS